MYKSACIHPAPTIPPPQSFRYYPTNIDVISWLGAYYMDSQFADKAVHYFERAALIQYDDVIHPPSHVFKQAEASHLAVIKTDLLWFLCRGCDTWLSSESIKVAIRRLHQVHFCLHRAL